MFLNALFALLLSFFVVSVVSIIASYTAIMVATIINKESYASLKSVVVNSLSFHGVLMSFGCWVFGLLAIPVLFLPFKSELLPMFFLSIFVYLLFNSFMNFIAGEYFENAGIKKDILIILASLALTYGFLVIPNVWYKLFLLIVVVIGQLILIIKEFSGKWETMLRPETYSCKADFFFWYYPGLAPLIFLLVSMFVI